MLKHVLFLVFLFTIGFYSCGNEHNTNTDEEVFDLSRFSEEGRAWVLADTSFFVELIEELEKTTDKNKFYGDALKFYGVCGRVVVPFDDSCQREVHHVYNDLEIDSEKEIMNKINVINGFKTYMKSDMLFHCEFDEETVESIVKKHWKKCELMSDEDFQNIENDFNNYALKLAACDSCVQTGFHYYYKYYRCY